MSKIFITILTMSVLNFANDRISDEVFQSRKISDGEQELNDDVLEAEKYVSDNKQVYSQTTKEHSNQSFQSEEEAAAHGCRWHYELEHSWMLPGSAWAEEVRQNAALENCRR